MRGETLTCDFFSRVLPCVGFYLGGYVDDANPSASEQHAAQAVVSVWHSMYAGSKARDFNIRDAGVLNVPGLSRDGTIKQPAEWQRH
jgi:hypothetical protein